ncbi:hypothetical protein BH11PLA2_BH11PLA2_17570 [soil metagenome]
MNVLCKPKIVLLGMMTKIPVAGAVWGTMQYLVGLERLGYEAYYVEAHARTPSMLMVNDDDDSSALAAAYIDGIMKRFDLGGRWAFHALHDDGRCYGLSETELLRLYRDAALIINYHGGTVPLPEHYATGRLIYLETDPVELEIELYNNDANTIVFLEPHVAFFTWGLNFNNPDCLVPMPPRFHFQPSCPPVLLDQWESDDAGSADTFTTIGNWRQTQYVVYNGETYTWSKHHEFLKVLGVPNRTGQRIELGLASYDESERQMLEGRGWHVRPAEEFSHNVDTYRDYIRKSRGEFTVAKDQNVRLRSGWFSERSAQYLAAGRPVVTQETGFCNVLPTGRGLFGFRAEDDAVAAIDSINSDYPRHRKGAREIAQEFFAADVVLKKILSACGV